MTNRICACAVALSLTATACLINPRAAHAQLPPATPPAEGTRPEFPADKPAPVAAVPTTAKPSLLQPFIDGIGDLRHLPSWQNVSWLGAGLAAAAVTHAADTKVTDRFSSARTQTFKPGRVVGGTPLELGGAFAAYAIGRATNRPRVMNVGSDLIRAQILAELVTTGVKQSVRRSRPDGGSFSFPSGHTAVSFASATVLHRHFGWKVGVPAYAVAGYVAASRVQTKRHYLSDVAFGATVGIVAGRTVTVGRGHRLMVTPTASLDGGGIAFTWLGRR
jgi:membrane-associated phospholipid phosphatase